MDRLEGIAVSEGSLSIRLNPRVELLGVFRLQPEERELPLESVLRSDASGTGIHLDLGPYGAGDDRPAFVIEMRAPGEPTTAGRELPVLKAEGWCVESGSRQDFGSIGERVVVTTTPAIGDIRYLDEIDRVRLATSTRANLAAAATNDDRRRILESAAQESQSRGFNDLASQYRAGQVNLGSGMDAGDVVNLTGTSTSQPKQSTRPNAMLQAADYLEPPSSAPRMVDDEPPTPPPDVSSQKTEPTPTDPMPTDPMLGSPG
jgi:hypothetical protein